MVFDSATGDVVSLAEHEERTILRCSQKLAQAGAAKIAEQLGSDELIDYTTNEFVVDVGPDGNDDEDGANGNRLYGHEAVLNGSQKRKASDDDGSDDEGVAEKRVRL